METLIELKLFNSSFSSLSPEKQVWKGTDGVSANGVTAYLIFVDRWTFWVLPFTYFNLPKSARASLFPQSVKTHYLCSGPISVDPICPQPQKVTRGSSESSRSGSSPEDRVGAEVAFGISAYKMSCHQIITYILRRDTTQPRNPPLAYWLK